MHAQGGLPIPGIVHIDQPHDWAHRDGAAKGLSREEFGVVAAGWLEEKILALGPEKVAAFIAEPVQGAGGVIVPPSTYWPEIQRICDRHGILLISDEVICGFGRTGQWWGCETFGTTPDLMTFAKGVTSGYVPLGGVMVGERVARVLIERGGEFEHGFTYSGHPVACAVALANLELIEQQGLVQRVREDTGPYLADRLAMLLDHPIVGDVQSCGLMAAIQLARDPHEREAFAAEHRDRPGVPKALFRERPRDAGGRRPDDHRAAADHHPRPDRRDVRSDSASPRSHVCGGPCCRMAGGSRELMRRVVRERARQTVRSWTERPLQL